MWKTISSKEVFNHPRITIVEDEVMLPSGREVKYLKFKNSGNIAVLICRRDDGKILLQREYSYVVNKKIFQFPGGGIGLNEDAGEGANRELMEESKLKANRMTLLASYLPLHRRSDHRGYVFMAEDFEKAELANDEEESIEHSWVDEKKIDEIIRRGEDFDANSLIAWLYYRLVKF